MPQDRSSKLGLNQKEVIGKVEEIISFSGETKSGEGSSTHTRATKLVCELCRTNGHVCWDSLKNQKEWDGVVQRRTTILVSTGLLNMGNHWADECPFRSDGDDDSGATMTAVLGCRGSWNL